MFYVKRKELIKLLKTELNNSFTNQNGQMRLSVDASLFTDMTSETLPSNLIFSFVLQYICHRAFFADLSV